MAKARSTDHFYELSKWELDENVRKEIIGTGFEFFLPLVANGNAGYLTDMKFNEVVNTFYDQDKFCFNFGEKDSIERRVFFGADTILYLTGLKFLGEPVVREEINLGNIDDVGRYKVDGLGWVDAKFIRSKRITLKGLREFMKVKDDRSLEHCVNAFILYVVKTVIVPTSGPEVPLSYLGSIRDGRYKDCAWGMAMLANMHYYLTKQKIGQEYQSTSTFFFMVFFLEHFPALRDALFRTMDENPSFSETGSLPTEYPLMLGWAHHIVNILKNKHTRDQDPKTIINLMRTSEITWRAYERLGESFLHPNIRGDLVMKYYRGVLIHPQHCGTTSAQICHLPNCCPKSFGKDNASVGRLPVVVKPYKGVEAMKTQFNGWEEFLIFKQGVGDCLGGPNAVSAEMDFTPASPAHGGNATTHLQGK